MYKVTWDVETGGVLLNSRIVEGTLGTAPRPVFWEELDLLKLNELGWDYPHCQEPLLWAVNKQYWYRGEMCFEAKGANIYDAATVVFQPGKERLSLKAVDVKRMLKKNSDYMFLLESEAIEFIHETFVQYAGASRSAKSIAANRLDYEEMARRLEAKRKQKMAIVKEDCDSFDIMPLEQAAAEGKKVYQTTKIDKFLASFSGGKDSQVVLDLCTRAIPSTEFEVIYSDTGYELPPSLELYKEVQEHYKRLFPDLKFSLTRNHDSVLNYWDKIGTPSDTHRWCCSVMKTAPLYRSLKVEGTNRQAKVLTFEGVRAEESTRRSSYARIGRGVKHDTVINARPILHWNTTEIFLYLIKNHLPINIAYRQGMTRVGCLICPFANEWNEHIANVKYRECLSPFLKRVENYSAKAGVKDIKEFVREGGWKRRASGNFVEQKTFVDFQNKENKFIAHIKGANCSVLTYLYILGEYTYSVKNHNITGEINIKGSIYEFALREINGDTTFTVYDVTDILLIGQLKKIVCKSSYCIQCEVCEVECPTGALQIYPQINVDRNKCIHCHRCLDFHDRGCVVANSLLITTANSMNTKTGNIDRYKNFGLKEEWLEDFLIDVENYWTGPHGLNEDYQVPSLKAWLRDSELIDSKSNPTELGYFLSDLGVRQNYPNLSWEIVWINLAYNSFIVNWFTQNVDSDAVYSSKVLEEMLKEQHAEYKDKTIHNAIYQLRRTLRESPIGESLRQYVGVDKETFKRESHCELSCEALAYSLYKYAEQKGVRTLSISDLYQKGNSYGIFKEFRVARSVVESLLRQLNSSKNRVLIAELNMGLESITLREDLTPMSCLKQLIEK